MVFVNWAIGEWLIVHLAVGRLAFYSFLESSYQKTLKSGIGATFIEKKKRIVVSLSPGRDYLV